jgi:hypothetical protein
MPVPQRPITSTRTRHPRYCHLSILLLFLGSATQLLARGPEPPLRIPLEPLGFQPQSAQFLAAGSSMFTVHYVDDHHLLLTFAARRLLTRLPDEPEDDQDRHVDALLLELPTGKIIARTSWRLHDHGQYLWSLGHGRFLLRIRDTLTSFAPLANLSTGQPFRERPFLLVSRRIRALLLSPDASLLIVETVARTPPVPKPKTPLFGPTPPTQPTQSTDPTPVQISFYRLSAPSDSSEEISPRIAGIVRSSNTGNIPSTAAGYLATIDQGGQHWAFDFDSYTGIKKELSPFDSTCRPAPLFVSRSEFIAFGCRAGDTRQLLGGFNMRGEEMWEQKLFGNYIAPSLAFAPASGRFAFSRILLNVSDIPEQSISAEEMSNQNIVVYQTSSGKQILRADCSPVERAGQNFALSPNGLGLAVIHAEAIEIYSLPPLTTKEAADVQLAESSAPEENDAPVHFAESEASAAAVEAVSETKSDPDASTATENLSPDAKRGTQTAASSSTTTPPDSTPSQSDASTAVSAGDPPPNQPRKPPTLYTLPTDAPHTPQSDQPQ